MKNLIWKLTINTIHFIIDSSVFMKVKLIIKSTILFQFRH